ADELRPDVVLMDQRMPDLSGAEATREIIACHPTMRIVALSVFSDDADIEAALTAGACGFVTKDTSIDGVCEAIRVARSGGAWLSPCAAEFVLRHVRGAGSNQRDGADPAPDLSEREREVLALVAHGMENADIADALSISPRTAKNHVSHVLSKLGLPNRVHAAVYAVRRGLV
ncbi:MAG: response regulator transcription factor, partial [Pseudonocardia sp.]|nr:response regulator transcription factor [Pseudonocardia sp.]